MDVGVAIARTAPVAAGIVLGVVSVAWLAVTARRTLLRPDGEPVAGYPEVIARTPARGLWAFFPHLALAVFVIAVAVAPSQVEPKILALLGAGAAYTLTGGWLAAESAPWAFGARRLDDDAERAVAGALGGLIRRVWVTPYPMAGGPVGTVALVAGRSLFVWNSVGRLAPEQIAAGAAFRAGRRRAWPAAIVAVWAARPYEHAAGITVARWTLTATAVLGLIAALVSEARWIGARRKLATGEANAAAAVEAILIVGREQARLAAAGADPNEPRAAAGVAELLWRRALVQAERVAGQARLDPSSVAGAAERVRAAEPVRIPAPATAEH